MERVSNEDLFMSACEKGNVEDVKKLLNNGFDINTKDRHGNSCLFYTKSQSMARFLVTSGAVTDLTNVKGETALHVASERGNKEMVLFLILNGTDPNVSNVDGKKAEELNTSFRPLIYAVNNDKQAYNSINLNQKKRLLQIFEEVDQDAAGYWNLERSIRFNCFIENVDEDLARRDAQDFIRDVSICRNGLVNQEEWLLSFGKLAADEGPGVVDSFLDDYDKSVREKGKFEKHNQ